MRKVQISKPPPPPSASAPKRPAAMGPSWPDLPVSGDATVIRLPPGYYVHILDTNTHITEVIMGPATVTRRDHETLVKGPSHVVVIPPGFHTIIQDPVVKDAEDKPVREKGQWKLRFGDAEVRCARESFPLYPGETMQIPVTQLQVIPADSAFRLRAERDFTDAEGVAHGAGDEWLIPGPRTFVPMVAAKVTDYVQARVLGTNQALRLRARKDIVEGGKLLRKAGEVWLLRHMGSYLPGVDEIEEGVVDAYTITEGSALQLRAKRTFTDIYGIERSAGQEWLVTLGMSPVPIHLPDVYEEVVREVAATVLTNRQYAVVLNPVDAVSGKPQLGRKELRRGPHVFFLQPGESLENGIQNIYVLGDDAALLCRADEKILDDGVARAAGDRWLVKGPKEYCPCVGVTVIDQRKKIPLDEGEGVYVRDTRSGGVRAVIGNTYMLTESEELWSKDLPAQVTALLPEPRKDATRVVSYRVPHNAAMQIYDYRQKSARVVFGPSLVLLEPDEQFTQLSLSGGKPKRPNEIRALVLLLGPDFMTDILTVETADHARLNLKLSYAWHFNIDKANPEDGKRLFSVPDFVGDCCKAIASRVRGAVAAVPFDKFHKYSATIINDAVFGEGKSQLVFSVNNLVVNAVDIQSVEPVDQRTRDSLMKSVQMAIEITTSSQEATALHEAQRTEQEAVGALERQKIEDQAEAEKARKRLLELKSESAAVQSSGQAKAEAKARAEAAQIEGEAAVTQASLRTKAAEIESGGELDRMTHYQHAELEHQSSLNELEITRAKALADIETSKFKNTVEAIGRGTIMKIAQAGPEMQAKLLQGLGLQGFLVTDGHSPINLFNTANGLIGGGVPT